MSHHFDIINHISQEKHSNNAHSKQKNETEPLDKMIKKNYISNQYRIASISYSLIACLMGLVIATLEPLKTCNYWKRMFLLPNSNFRVSFFLNIKRLKM